LSPSVDPPPAFHDAVARFRSYLKANGRPETIVWVELDELLQVKNRLRVLLRPPHTMWMKAQCTYELGLDRKMGVLLQQVCQIPGLSCCHVYIPKNPQDAEQRLDGSALKLAFPEEVRRATAVTNRLHWALLKMTGSRLLS
jgi:hypothetical protein